MMNDKHTSRKTARLTRDEWMTGYCGKVSDAEVLRYLVREWSETDHFVGC